jgi:hypothetical protein
MRKFLSENPLPYLLPYLATSVHLTFVLAGVVALYLKGVGRATVRHESESQIFHDSVGKCHRRRLWVTAFFDIWLENFVENSCSSKSTMCQG